MEGYCVMMKRHDHPPCQSVHQDAGKPQALMRQHDGGYRDRRIDGSRRFEDRDDEMLDP